MERIKSYKDLPPYAQSDIQTLDDFQKWFWWTEVETWGGVMNIIEDGKLDIATDPLGLFLEVARFDNSETLEKLALSLQEDNEIKSKTHDGDDEFIGGGKPGPSHWEDDMEEKGFQLEDHFNNLYPFKNFGFTKDNIGSYIQNASIYELTAFVKKWYEAQSKDKIWNPKYIEVNISDPLKEFCRRHTPEHVIKKLDVSNDESGGLIYPCDGWTLAKCIRTSYERKKK